MRKRAQEQPHITKNKVHDEERQQAKRTGKAGCKAGRGGASTSNKATGGKGAA